MNAEIHGGDDTLAAEFRNEYGGMPGEPRNEFFTAAAIVGVPAAISAGTNLTKDALAYLREHPISITVRRSKRLEDALDLHLDIRNNRGHGCVIRAISVSATPASFRVHSMAMAPSQPQTNPIVVDPGAVQDVRVSAHSDASNAGAVLSIEVFFQFFDRPPPEAKLKKMGSALARFVGLGDDVAQERFESLSQSLFVPDW